MNRIADALQRQLARDAGVDGRWIAAVAVAVYFGAVAVAHAAWEVDLWRVLGVPSAPFLFFDTHNLTAAGECLQRGIDPFVSNPCDFHDRPWNYPRLWLVLAWLGMDHSWRISFGVFHVAAFLGAGWWLVGRLTAGQGVVLALLAVSPAFMFAIERGQADLVVFLLVALAVLAWRRGEHGRTLHPLTVLVASLLKLFPVVGLGAGVLSRHVRAALVSVVSGALFVAWFVANLDEMRVIGERAPQGQVYSYGARILVGHVARRVLDADISGAWTRQAAAAAVVGVLAAAIAVWVFRHPASRPPPDCGPVTWRLHAFHLGALVYVGTFAVANNWDYRLIFLLLLVPQLFEWIGRSDEPLRGLASLTLPVVVVQCYLGAIVAYWTLHTEMDWEQLPTWALADELLSWLLAGLLVAALVPSARSAITWLKDLARRGGNRPHDRQAGTSDGSRR